MCQHLYFLMCLIQLAAGNAHGQQYLRLGALTLILAIFHPARRQHQRGGHTRYPANPRLARGTHPRRGNPCQHPLREIGRRLLAPQRQPEFIVESHKIPIPSQKTDPRSVPIHGTISRATAPAPAAIDSSPCPPECPKYWRSPPDPDPPGNAKPRWLAPSPAAPPPTSSAPSSAADRPWTPPLPAPARFPNSPSAAAAAAALHPAHDCWSPAAARTARAPPIPVPPGAGAAPEIHPALALPP